MTIDIPKKLSDEITSFCKSNTIDNIDDFILKIIKKGFDLEKWGDINVDITDTTDEVIFPQIDKRMEDIKRTPLITVKNDNKPINQPIKEKTTKVIENQKSDDIYDEN
jgi:hypothetical protein